MTPDPRQIVRRARALRGVAPEARWGAVQEVAGEQAQKLIKRTRRRAVTGQVRVVELSAGPERANQYFWRMPKRRPTWFDVEQRIERLSTHHPEARDHFVRETIRRTDDPITIAGLTRHPAGSTALAAWLTKLVTPDGSTTLARLARNQNLGGAYVGAARVLLDVHTAKVVSTSITDLYDFPEERFFRVADSFSWWPAASPAQPGHSGPASVENRLVIAESANDVDALALLLPGAARTTVLATNDTFGAADFAAYSAWPGVGEVTVEHVRSRLTRFSQEYIDLHESAKSVGQRIAGRLTGLSGLVEPGDVPFLEVEIADFLFFQALKIRAIDALVTDGGFDHIVLATATHRPTDEFVRLAASVNGLTSDPRLEVVSISRSATVRLQFWWIVDALTNSPIVTTRQQRRMPVDIVLERFDALARKGALRLGRFPRQDRPWIGVATANNPAYNRSTAAYVGELQTDYDVRLLHLGRNATDVAEHLEDTADTTVPIDFVAPSAGEFGSLAQLLEIQMGGGEPPKDTSMSPSEHAAEWALYCCSLRLATDVVAPALERMRTLHHWFTDLQRTSELPDAFVLSPHRNAGVGVVASVARRFGVPTVTVEPHAQDANYSRYIKVAADYYGVMSDYFRRQTSTAFGAGDDRTVVIGSPRQIAPAGYDPVVAQQTEREHARRDGIEFPGGVTQLVFFGQPSDWSHVNSVWSNVLDAALSTQSRVLLKPHPEEATTRTREYLDLAAERNAGHLVTLLDGGAERAIALGDIVLTAYSTAGVDAAIRQRPVVCVTNGDVPYPLDLSAMVDAYVARSADELSALIIEFQTNPKEFEQRARSLLERERQFIDGPGPRLRALVDRAITAGTSGIRSEAELPASLFLDGPHPVFPV